VQANSLAGARTFAGRIRQQGEHMIVRILGAAAGGGFPQWNCSCRNCKKARGGSASHRAQMQSSLAASTDGKSWVLLNASPDLRQQIMAAPSLNPHNGALRSSPIKAVVLTNGDVDHIIGLVNLRESQPFTIYATERVLDVIESNSVFRILAPNIVARVPLQLGESVPILGAGTDTGLTVEAFDVPGKIALYLEDVSAGPSFGTRVGDTIGLKITETASGASFFYIPGCADVNEALRKRLARSSHLFFDGTLYSDDEMICQGLLDKSGARMGHISMSGIDGSIAAFAELGIGRKIYVHINNSNPVLDASSLQRKAVESAGWEIGQDGMEISL
jgi:pyrroloquinoline quinone biosynthesis protein B